MSKREPDDELTIRREDDREELSSGPDDEESATNGRNKTEFQHERAQRLNRLEHDHGMRKRFIAAIFGGLSVIAPMLVMAIHPSQVKTLVTASVAVVVFALALAWKSSAQVEVMLATTAAYAAVLVVFVGISGN